MTHTEGAAMSIVERLNKLADELDLWFGPNKPAGNELRTIATDLRSQEAVGDVEFKRGVKEAFDWFYARAANNYHGNPRINERCKIENEAACEWARDMLADLSPEDSTTWRSLTDALNTIEAQARR